MAIKKMNRFSVYLMVEKEKDYGYDRKRIEVVTEKDGLSDEDVKSIVGECSIFGEFDYYEFDEEFFIVS